MTFAVDWALNNNYLSRLVFSGTSTSSCCRLSWLDRQNPDRSRYRHSVKPAIAVLMINLVVHPHIVLVFQLRPLEDVTSGVGERQ